jgi:hypothetical protein
MVRSWNVSGIVACIVIAAGGLALGALGVRRRDVAR